MKSSIRTKFAIGIVFFFVIISVLSIFSAYYLNRLSEKTRAILRENHLSVIYARDMSESLMKMNQEIIKCFLVKNSADTLLIYKEIGLFDKSLQLAKNNITEPGENELVEDINRNFNEYCNSVSEFMTPYDTVAKVLALQTEFSDLYQHLLSLSQINEKAIQLKTDAAKESAKSALTQMTFLATLCFLIALSFTYSFASYFNERFSQLYNGIKEIVSSNYGQRLYFDGKDEFYEISLVFNEMAEKLNKNEEEMKLTLQADFEKEHRFDNIHELKRFLNRVKSIEEQTLKLITRIKNEI